MAEGAFAVYDKTMEYCLDGTIDVDTHTFKVIYLDNTYTPNTASHSALANVTSAELSASDGTSLIQTLSSVTWAITSSSSVSVVRFDAADVTMSTSSTVKVRYVAIYDDSTTSPVDALLCLSELTTTGTGVAVTQLTLQFASTGIFKCKRG